MRLAESGALRVLRRTVAERRVVLELVRRDLRARYAGSRFGLAWSLLNPVVQLVSYGAIFSFIYRATEETPRGVFLATLFCGLFPWWAFQEGTLRGLSALVDHAALLKKAPLPPEVCVVATVCASFLLQSVGFGVFLVVFALIGLVPLSLSLALVVPVLGLGLLLAVGAALVLAPLHLVVRDTGYVATAVMTVVFFASPVLYRLDALPPALRSIAYLNPMAGIIELCRGFVLGLAFDPVAALLAPIVATAALWMLGGWLLGRLEVVFDEYL